VEIFLATRNPGKLREIEAILRDLPVTLTIPPEMPDVDETGASFAENALLKAGALARHLGAWALADDSGLEVDALAGAPGLYSARFGGLSTDSDRTMLLLERLRDVPDAARTARFRAAVALCGPDRPTVIREGACEGLITRAPRGSGGFGYDPVFLLPEFGLTMAELCPEIKNRISHRARALEAIRPDIEEALRGGVRR